MKNILVILLALILAVGCDDEKKDDHKDCGCPLAGAMMEAGEEMMDGGMQEEEVDAGEEVEAGEDAGQEEGGDMAGEEPCDCEGEDCAC